MKTRETVSEFIKRKDAQFKNEKSLIPMKDIGRRGKFFFQGEVWTFLPQHNLPEKVFIFEGIDKTMKRCKIKTFLIRKERNSARERYSSDCPTKYTGKDSIG